jgi:hypothetical protein
MRQPLRFELRPRQGWRVLLIGHGNIGWVYHWGLTHWGSEDEQGLVDGPFHSKMAAARSLMPDA